MTRAAIKCATGIVCLLGIFAIPHLFRRFWSTVSRTIARRNSGIFAGAQIAKTANMLPDIVRRPVRTVLKSLRPLCITSRRFNRHQSRIIGPQHSLLLDRELIPRWQLPLYARRYDRTASRIARAVRNSSPLNRNLSADFAATLDGITKNYVRSWPGQRAATTSLS